MILRETRDLRHMWSGKVRLGASQGGDEGFNLRALVKIIEDSFVDVYSKAADVDQKVGDISIVLGELTANNNRKIYQTLRIPP